MFYLVAIPSEVWNDKWNHEQEIVTLQELRNGVLPYTFTNIKVKRFFGFQTEDRLENSFDGSYGKHFSRSFSFFILKDFSIHSFHSCNKIL